MTYQYGREAVIATSPTPQRQTNAAGGYRYRQRYLSISSVVVVAALASPFVCLFDGLLFVDALRHDAHMVLRAYCVPGHTPVYPTPDAAAAESGEHAGGV